MRDRATALLSLGSLVLLVGLVGCAGFNAAAPMPDIPTEVAPGAIQGSVFGGHGPVVGAHVYVLETATAYNGTSLSKLTSGAGTDSVGTYVLTDNNGAFSISGAYTCDVGRPVYIAAAGGAPNSYPPFAVTNVTATMVTTGNYNFQFTGNNLTYVGQQVALSGLTIDTFLNGTTPTVTAQTSTSFTVNVSTAKVVSSGATSGTATPQGVSNPAIVNMAVLGLCPGTANEFASTIHYVYMNEVSTVAAAYALSGFGTGPYTIGAPASNLLGIQNATANANLLYDIQGSQVGTAGNGDAHIGRSTTPAGNGISPQATVNTLGNILAACVDSSNSAQASSTACNNLLNNATDAAGNIPTNIAAAAFNIAHNPAGPPGVISYNWVYILYNIPNAVVPFTPVLAAQPNDFTLAVEYTKTSEGTNSIVATGPQSVAADASGNFWYTTQPTTSTAAGYMEESSPLGVNLFSYKSGNASPYGNVNIDSAGNAWAGNLTGYFGPIEVVPGTPYTPYTNFAGPYTNGQAAVSDGSGDVFFTHGPTAGYPTNPTCCALELTEIVPTRSSAANQPSLSTSFGNNYVNHGAIDSGGFLWFDSEIGNAITRVAANTTTGAADTGFPINSSTASANCNGSTISSPESIAIDRSGTAWIPIYKNGSGSSVLQLAANGGAPTCTFFNVGSGPYGVAVDGKNNVWITNRGGNSLAALNAATGAYVTPNVNLTAGGLLSDPMNVAIDISGDVMVTNFGGNALVELIGAAAPTYGPLSLAASRSKLGVTP